jgi:cytochrome c biogenesis protein CcmG/thiol:disulfide interchange protein DsbE
VWIAVAVVVALLVVATALGVFTDGPDPRTEGGVAEVEMPLPPLQGDGVTGGSVSIQDLGGTVTVVNVWATWCDPCRREQPALRALAERYADRGVSFVGIDYRDDIHKARDWIDSYDVPYPSLSDPQGRTAASLSFPFLPDTYVIDSTGTVRFVAYGETDEAELGGLIDQVLGDSSS